MINEWLPNRVEDDDDITPFTGATVRSILAAGDLRGQQFNLLRRIVHLGIGADRGFLEIERLTKVPSERYLRALRMRILDPLLGELADVGIASVWHFGNQNIALVTQPLGCQGGSLPKTSATCVQVYCPAGHRLQALLDEVLYEIR